MPITVDLEDIKNKLVDKVKPSGWALKLKGFIQSSEFDKILNTLYVEREAGKRFTPPLKYVFRAFEECPLKDLKVVVIGQDPYPYMGVADGVAVSCSLTAKPQPSLRHILKAVNESCYGGLPVSEDPDLVRWSNQGVLLLNSALTCEVDKPGTHVPIWNDFLMYLIDMLSLTSSGLVFILMGKQAQELEPVIGASHHILKTHHPAYAARTGTDWDCENVFNKTNEILKQSNGEEFQIRW